MESSQGLDYKEVENVVRIKSMTEKKRDKRLQNGVFLLSKVNIKILGSAATAPQKGGKIKNRK